jgi:hypothetical protein
MTCRKREFNSYQLGKRRKDQANLNYDTQDKATGSIG